MIDKLTRENLQKLGFKEADVKDLLNTTENYTLQCNEGNVFVSKPEDKLYTGIDMYRKLYFTENNINFPFSCPDLFDEYFELSLAKFFEKQKEELSIHFDEKNQFDKFISLDTKRSKEIIKDNKEYIKEHPNRRWVRREKANNILETYIQFLDNKLFINQKTNAIKPEKRIPVYQIALTYYYKDNHITEDNANEIANSFGWIAKNSGKGLLQDYQNYCEKSYRTADPQSKVILKNKINLFETVLELLPEGKKAKAFGDISILKKHLSEY